MAAVALTPVLRSCQKPFTADTRLRVPTITTASFPSPPLFPDNRAVGARHQSVRLNKESPPSKWRFFSTSFLRREGEHFLPAYPLCCAGFTQQGSAAVDIGSLSDELFVNTHTPNSLIQMATSAALRRQCCFLAASQGRGGVRRSIMVFKVRSLLPQSGQTALEH